MALKMPTVEASRKVWLSRAGELVEDGDNEAAALFARKGQKFRPSALDRFSNASDFFPGLATAEEAQEGARPQATVKKPGKAPSRRRGGLF